MWKGKLRIETGKFIKLFGTEIQPELGLAIVYQGFRMGSLSLFFQ